MLLNWMLNDDIGRNRPVIYWAIWGAALFGTGSAWFDRHNRNKKRRVIEEHQYHQAVNASKQEPPDSEN